MPCAGDRAALRTAFYRRFLRQPAIGKGTHRAILRSNQFARQYAYVLQCDLEQFFPSIDHAILRAALAKIHPGPRVMDLVDRILASGAGVLAQEYQMCWFPGDDLLAGAAPTRSAHRQLDLSILGERAPEQLRPLCQTRAALQGATYATWMISCCLQMTKPARGAGGRPSSPAWHPCA